MYLVLRACVGVEGGLKKSGLGLGALKPKHEAVRRSACDVSSLGTAWQFTK